MLQIALGRYWHALGVEPRLLLGHGTGEYAAACLAGVFSLDDACDWLPPCCGSLIPRWTGRPEAFRQVADHVTYQRPPGPMCRASPAPGHRTNVATADYWCRHLTPRPRRPDPLRRRAARAPGRRADGVPGSGRRPTRWPRRCAPRSGDAAPCVLAGLRGDDQEWTAHLTTLGQLYVQGTPLRWSQVWGTAPTK